MSRWYVLASLIGVTMTFASPATTAGADTPADNSEVPMKYRVYIGTYTGEGSEGIYQTELDLETGKLTEVELAGKLANPSFLAIHPSQKYLYAVAELSDYQGKSSGAVAAFQIDPASGKLTLLNEQPSDGGWPCHIVIDKSGKFALIANYGGGSAAVLPIDSDGKLAKIASFAQHKGNSVNKDRQEAPHAHSINLDAANKFAVVADLGLDQVLVYRFDSRTGKLSPNRPPFVEVETGAGPRHFAFHPGGQFAYVINELTCSVTAFQYDARTGVLQPLQSITTLPNGFDGPDYSTAEVQVHPNGKFLYGSNRGHHSIAAFAIDPDSGKLTAIGHAKETIKTPRNFGIDPTGRYLLVANQDGNSISVFQIDPDTGALTFTGHQTQVSRPVCLKFMPLAAPK